MSGSSINGFLDTHATQSHDRNRRGENSFIEHQSLQLRSPPAHPPVSTQAWSGRCDRTGSVCTDTRRPGSHSGTADTPTSARICAMCDTCCTSVHWPGCQSRTKSNSTDARCLSATLTQDTQTHSLSQLRAQNRGERTNRCAKYGFIDQDINRDGCGSKITSTSCTIQRRAVQRRSTWPHRPPCSAWHESRRWPSSECARAPRRSARPPAQSSPS